MGRAELGSEGEERASGIDPGADVLSKSGCQMFEQEFEMGFYLGFGSLCLHAFIIIIFLKHEIICNVYVERECVVTVRYDRLGTDSTANV